MRQFFREHPEVLPLLLLTLVAFAKFHAHPRAQFAGDKVLWIDPPKVEMIHLDQ